MFISQWFNDQNKLKISYFSVRSTRNLSHTKKAINDNKLLHISDLFIVTSY